jgi:hypothetical protein
VKIDHDGLALGRPTLGAILDGDYYLLEERGYFVATRETSLERTSGKG